MSSPTQRSLVNEYVVHATPAHGSTAGGGGDAGGGGGLTPGGGGGGSTYPQVMEFASTNLFAKYSLFVAPDEAYLTYPTRCLLFTPSQ